MIASQQPYQRWHYPIASDWDHGRISSSESLSEQQDTARNSAVIILSSMQKASDKIVVIDSAFAC